MENLKSTQNIIILALVTIRNHTFVVSILSQAGVQKGPTVDTGDGGLIDLL